MINKLLSHGIAILRLAVCTHITLVASTVIMPAIFLFYVPLEQLLSYFVVAALWLSEFIVLGVLYSLYRKAANPAAGGLVRSGFGEQRPDIGSRAPSQRR